MKNLAIIFTLFASIQLSSCKKETTIIPQKESANQEINKIEEIHIGGKSSREAVKTCGWISISSSGCPRPALECKIRGNDCKCGKVVCPTLIPLSEWGRAAPTITSYNDIYIRLEQRDPLLLKYLANL